MTTLPPEQSVWNEQFYRHEDRPAAFRRSRDQWGEFSNMTGGCPITLHRVRFQSSEGLYQALKFPGNTPLQLTIASAKSGYSAKTVAYDSGQRPYPEWDAQRVDAMRVTLALKLVQNPAFAEVLLRTGNQDIVESSSRDAFWGARPVTGGFRGCNVLGRLLMELRDTTRNTGQQQLDQAARNFAEASFRHGFVIAGQRLATDLLTDIHTTTPCPEGNLPAVSTEPQSLPAPIQKPPSRLVPASLGTCPACRQTGTMDGLLRHVVSKHPEFPMPEWVPLNAPDRWRLESPHQRATADVAPQIHNRESPDFWWFVSAAGPGSIVRSGFGDTVEQAQERAAAAWLNHLWSDRK